MSLPTSEGVHLTPLGGFCLSHFLGLLIRITWNWKEFHEVSVGTVVKFPARFVDIRKLGGTLGLPAALRVLYASMLTDALVGGR